MNFVCISLHRYNKILNIVYVPGFIPKELFLGLDQGELRSHVCQRCYFLKHRNMALNVRVSPDVYPSILKSIQEEKALAIVVVDLLDVPCSIWPGIMDIIGQYKTLSLFACP